MGNKVLCVTGVIDTELWNKAGWCGTAVLSDGQSAPYLGLLFENREAAVKIFEQWNRDFGHKDIYEEIRISIIEGDIPEEEHGYTVHITTNQENLVSKCKELNIKIDEALFAIVSRFRRIETTKDNRNMAVFREEFERYLSYKIIPVYMSEARLEPLFDYEIEKTEIYFRMVDEISEGDIDAACIKNLHN
ncbi:MAG TPA: hypothetical protein DFI63_00600 [Lachnospiraceae bacterium]|uniref:hypothetical protein n=1 Tax=Blautia sp. An81 TaxID=1965659 RepID=UPI000B36BA71|nr:hypothetical protein [Blautia sp. An81]OUN25310.1 hypothetical protein B5G33_17995 [Blautia sp. An81]HCH96502.1 hypothetical protein [Lachnospiraceae bacterium]